MGDYKYESNVKHQLEKVVEWRKNGHTIEDVYRLLGISKPTALKYRKEYPEFEEAFERGKEVLESELAISLYKSGIGYEVEESRTIIEELPNGKKKIKTEITKKHVKSITAIIYALKTLNPQRWSEKQLLEHNIKGEGVPVKIIDNIPIPEHLVDRIKKEIDGVDPNDPIVRRQIWDQVLGRWGVSPPIVAKDDPVHKLGSSIPSAVEE